MFDSIELTLANHAPADWGNLAKKTQRLPRGYSSQTLCSLCLCVSIEFTQLPCRQSICAGIGDAQFAGNVIVRYYVAIVCATGRKQNTEAQRSQRGYSSQTLCSLCLCVSIEFTRFPRRQIICARICDTEFAGKVLVCYYVAIFVRQGGR